MKITRDILDERNAYEIKKFLDGAEETRWNYLKYFEETGIDLSGDYLVCDLISQGTVLNSLNRIFEKQQRGLFLARAGCLEEDIPVEPVYDKREWKDTRPLTCILEKVFTSLEPSIIDMDKEGKPVFSEEYRDENELEAVKKIHQAILDGVEAFYSLSGREIYISKELAQALFYTIEEVVFCDELKLFNDFILFDDLTKERLYFKRN